MRKYCILLCALLLAGCSGSIIPEASVVDRYSIETELVKSLEVDTYKLLNDLSESIDKDRKHFIFTIDSGKDKTRTIELITYKDMVSYNISKTGYSYIEVKELKEPIEKSGFKYYPKIYEIKVFLNI